MVAKVCISRSIFASAAVAWSSRPRVRSTTPAAVKRGARLRVATKYVTTAREHFAGKGMHVDLIRLYGSMELAPLVGLADAIVDLVSTGNTLRANDLVAVEEILAISARLVVNPAALKLKREKMQPLLEAIAAAVGASAPMDEMLRLDSSAPGFDAALARLTAVAPNEDARVEAVVAAILADIRARGDAAVLEYTSRFDRVEAPSVAALAIPATELEAAFTRWRQGSARHLRRRRRASVPFTSGSVQTRGHSPKLTARG